jgi:hypothetical protein
MGIKTLPAQADAGRTHLDLRQLFVRRVCQNRNQVNWYFKGGSIRKLHVQRALPLVKPRPARMGLGPELTLCTPTRPCDLGQDLGVTQ